MCLPDYVYGLILIESLRNEVAQDRAGSADHSVRRKLRTIYRSQPKRIPTDLIDADNVVAAGA